jgi:hypothetical protein
MTNKIMEIENIDGTTVEWVEIDRGNGEFTSMPKSVYDAQVEHLTENLP